MPGESIGDRLEAWANWIEQKPWIIIAVLAASYLFFLDIPMRYFLLWYDELHTYYIAQAPTVAKFVEEVRNTDLNPPMLFALVRASYVLFGVSAFSTRIPSAIAFFLASMGLFVFMRRRVGALWSSAAIALFWYGPFFRYATEARPYGLLLLFFALTLVSWDSAASSSGRRGKALAGIVLGNSGMMLSHVLAPLSIMPFCVAELFQNWRDRKIDWAVWTALLLPLGWVVAIIPFIQKVGAAKYPPAFQASFQKILAFYLDVIAGTIPAAVIALGIALLIAAWRSRGAESKPIISVRDWPMLAASLLPPILVNLAMMRSGGPFWDRYALTTVAMIYVLAILYVAQECKLNRLAGLAAMLILIGFHIGRDVVVLVQFSRPTPADAQRIDQVKPDLPFVANSGLTFLAMDHNESPELVSRLYYLVDEASALRYAQTNIFEGLPILKEYFPIRANFASYSEFAAKYPHFLVLGTINQSEDWLLRKLIAEGANVTQIGSFNLPYQDTTLYEVRLPPDHSPLK